MVSMDPKLEEFHRLTEKLRVDFLLFCKVVCGVTLYGDQIEFALRIQRLTIDPSLTPKQIGVKAGTGVGKSKLMALALLWRHWRSHGSKHMVTAPTERQLRKVAFSELASTIRESELLTSMYVVSGLRVYMKGYPEWEIFGAAATDENALRGTHHPEMTGAVEELTGVEDPNINTIRRTLSQKNNLFISIFNPDKVTGVAYDMFHGSRHMWPHNMTINKLELSKVAPHIVDPGKIEEIREEFGEESHQWMVGVLGEFPLEGMKNVIPLSLFNRARATNPAAVIALTPPARVIGVDFGMEGGDANVAAVRCGNAITDLISFGGDADDFAKFTLSLPDQYGWGKDCLFVVDAIGVGATLPKLYRKAGFKVKRFQPNAKSRVRGFRNHMSASWYHMRNMAKRSLLYLPDNAKLEQQLITREFKYMGDNVEVESKKDYCKRGFSSPNHSDSVVMAFSNYKKSNTNDTSNRYAPKGGRLILPSEHSSRTLDVFGTGSPSSSLGSLAPMSHLWR